MGSSYGSAGFNVYSPTWPTLDCPTFSTLLATHLPSLQGWHVCTLLCSQNTCEGWHFFARY
jgi:hypothetical protein